MTQATLSTAASLPAVAIIDPSRGWLATIHPCGHIDGSAEAALDHLSRQTPGPAAQPGHTLMLAALRLALRGRTLDVPPRYDQQGFVVLRSLPLDTELHRSENAARASAEDLADSHPGKEIRVAQLLATYRQGACHVG
ncbi:hypothetical protein ACFFMP_08575 [Pseudoroseomonas cervicalis]|uniref:Uncharacterized protein n=1 Tax=Pseudoroseomonas cervicalis ATCC 49957 TaxID=525371 RepID=D5RTH8_9PROT|nr:hypothetical protein [Pseudoroseomonas cervicalis]EFH09409.1 hypothetical protein HMPREF0731_4390 [Pseudoroseomonas cervicalis ATCC 49957]